jgi:hypothetical protein
VELHPTVSSDEAQQVKSTSSPLRKAILSNNAKAIHRITLRARTTSLTAHQSPKFQKLLIGLDALVAVAAGTTAEKAAKAF